MQLDSLNDSCLFVVTSILNSLELLSIQRKYLMPWEIGTEKQADYQILTVTMAIIEMISQRDLIFRHIKVL